jgi:hypothetical protein
MRFGLTENRNANAMIAIEFQGFFFGISLSSLSRSVTRLGEISPFGRNDLGAFFSKISPKIYLNKI